MRKLSANDRLILEEASRIRRRVNEGFGSEISEKEALALLKEAVRYLRSLQRQYQRTEPDMSEMYRDDAEHMKEGAKLIRLKRYGSAYNHLQMQDTAARENVPGGVWDFLDSKLSERKVLQKAAESVEGVDENDFPFSYRSVLEDLIARKLLVSEFGWYGPYVLSKKGQRELDKPF